MIQGGSVIYKTTYKSISVPSRAPSSHLSEIRFEDTSIVNDVIALMKISISLTLTLAQLYSHLVNQRTSCPSVPPLSEITVNHCRCCIVARNGFLVLPVTCQVDKGGCKRQLGPTTVPSWRTCLYQHNKVRFSHCDILDQAHLLLEEFRW